MTRGHELSEEIFPGRQTYVRFCRWSSVPWVAMGDSLNRSARIAIRATKPQRRRLYGLLRSAGDVRALVLDCNRQFREWKLPPVVSYQALCRDPG